MAGDPKIKFDIEANATGQESVQALTKRLEDLAGELGGELGQQAAQAAAKLRELARQQDVIAEFARLQAEVKGTGKELAAAEKEADNFGRQISQAGPPTAEQAAALRKLGDSAQGVRDKLEGQKAAAAGAEAGISQLGVSAKDTSAAQIRLRGDVETLRASLDKTALAFDAAAQHGQAVGPALEQSFRVLGVQSVQQVEQEIRQLQAALAQIRSSPDVLSADKAAAVAAFNDKLAKLRGEAQAVPHAMAGIPPAADNVGNALAGAAKQAVGWAAALAGINSAGDLVHNLIDTGAQLEGLRVRLEGLLGSTEKATAAFGMLRELASTTPFEMSGLTESFIKLTTMGMQPSARQMQIFTDVAAQMGGGTENLSRVTEALGKAWEKGALQGHDLKALISAGIPVWDALANATGRNVLELQRMAEEGALGRDVIGKLIDEMGRMNTGASAKLLNTYAGAVGAAKESLAEFYDMVAQSGVLDFLREKVQALLVEFDRMKASGELQARAQAIADAFVGIGQKVEFVVRALADLWPQIKAVGQLAIAIRTANIVQSLASMAAGFVGVGAAAATATTAMRGAAVAAESSAAAMVGASASARIFSGLLGVMGKLSFVGLIAGAGQLVGEFFRAKQAAEDGDAAVRRMLETPPTTNAPKKAADDAAKALAAVPDKAADAIAAFDKLTAQGELTGVALGKIGKDFDLANAPGIKTAASVLEQLAQTGRITAGQFRDAWSTALKDVNLAEFEARARAAFVGMANEATLVQQSIDAGLRESIRRAGGDFDALSGGMSKASQDVVGNVDYMIDNMKRLKAQGVDVAQALTLSLGKGIDTADSRAALEALRVRVEAVRNVLGAKLAQGFLDEIAVKAAQAGSQLDELGRAAERLGIKSKAESAAIARQLGDDYTAIANSGKYSLEQQAAAFDMWSKAAQESGDPVIKSQVELARSVLKMKAEIAGVGDIFEREYGRAGDAISRAREEAAGLQAQMQSVPISLGGSNPIRSAVGGKAGPEVDNSGLFTAWAAFQSGSLGPGDLERLRKLLQVATDNAHLSTRYGSLQGSADASMWAVRARRMVEYVEGMAPARVSGAQPQGASGATRNVNISFNGAQLGSVRTDAAGDRVLQQLLDRLEQEARRAGP